MMRYLVFLLMVVLPSIYLAQKNFVVFDSTFSSSVNSNIAYESGKKTLYVKTPFKVYPMSNTLFNQTIATSNWSNDIYKKSRNAKYFSEGSTAFGLSGIGIGLLISGFANRFNIPMDNKPGYIIYGVCGSIAVSGGLSWLISHTVHKIRRKRYIKVFNVGLKEPLWSF